MRFLVAFLSLALGFVCSAQPQNHPQVFGFISDSGGSGSSIGVALRDIDADRAAMLKMGSVTGVEVIVVQPHSPAEQGGIKSGDVLLSYNHESIIGGEQLGRMVRETPAGRKVNIEYLRDGKVVNTTLTTAARSALIRSEHPGGIGVATGGGFGGDMLGLSSIPTPGFYWTNLQLGIEWEGLDSDSSQLADFFGVKHGVLIRAVAKDSPAAKAGLRAGDVLTQIEGHSVSDTRELDIFVQRSGRVSRTLTVEVTRQRKPVTVKIELGQE